MAATSAPSARVVLLPTAAVWCASPGDPCASIPRERGPFDSLEACQGECFADYPTGPFSRWGNSGFFTGAFIIEIVFSLDGLGLLGYESVLNRDYPVVFGTLFLFSLMGMVVKLISDLTYVWIDPRIDFESREA